MNPLECMWKGKESLYPSTIFNEEAPLFVLKSLLGGSDVAIQSIINPRIIAAVMYTIIQPLADIFFTILVLEADLRDSFILAHYAVT
jgi:hypothetical protein